VTTSPEHAHLLDAHGERDAGAPGLDRVDALIDRRRARGAGVLHPGHRRESHVVIELKDQRSREFLAVHAAVEGAEIDLVDVRGRDPRVVDGLARGAGDQTLQVNVVETAEAGVAPAHDTGGHDGSSGNGRY
jgi:hypothetical protein